MFVIRFRVQVQPDKADDLFAAFQDVVSASRDLTGVVSFDIGRDITDPNAFIATEVFEDDGARERQESLPQVATVMSMLPDSLAGPPEATIYHVSSSEPAM